jgi:hypothetical protein
MDVVVVDVEEDNKLCSATMNNKRECTFICFVFVFVFVFVAVAGGQVWRRLWVPPAASPTTRWYLLASSQRGLAAAWWPPWWLALSTIALSAHTHAAR